MQESETRVKNLWVPKLVMLGKIRLIVIKLWSVSVKALRSVSISANVSVIINPFTTVPSDQRIITSDSVHDPLCCMVVRAGRFSVQVNDVQNVMIDDDDLKLM